jgi:dTMP kinase
MSERGKYIPIDGVEFAGKTTQINMLKKYFAEQDREVRFIREPGETAVGVELRKLLFFPPEPLSDEVALHLFTADRLHTWQTVIEPALESGIPVIGDRSWRSTAGYQGARGNISVDHIIDVTSKSLPAEYVSPELAIVLTVPGAERKRRQAITALQDGSLDDFESRDDEYFEKVSQIYEDVLIKELGAIGIDGAQSPELVHQEIIRHVEQVLPQF